MYYDLTKEEYKKYEKSFTKTYVGKQLNIAKLSSGIIGVFLWGIFGWIIGYNSVEVFKVSLLEFSILFIGGLSLIESVLWHIQYRKELKKYIIEKSNK